jgi:adenosylcobinamide kinase / adenosylcobinamide-phosphate guanylyltransferase
MGKIVLVVGGARSGKSSFAERYVASKGKKIAYIATAQVYDEEMEYRVKLHKTRRPSAWKTYESPYRAERAIVEAAKEHDMILFDCITLYLSNLLCKENAAIDLAKDSKEVFAAFQQIVQAAKDANCTIVFVSNEVGAGIVPENALAREYRDLAGLVNQMIAREAEDVFLVTCGIPVNIKKIAENLGE